ncbi:hypothetical protein V1511DRAFT_499428 [Dipodascopsis uninucleata]
MLRLVLVLELAVPTWLFYSLPSVFVYLVKCSWRVHVSRNNNSNRISSDHETNIWHREPSCSVRQVLQSADNINSNSSIYRYRLLVSS